jgi:hypothetical protein
LQAKYSWYAPYQFAGNGPIANLDRDGKEEYNYTITLGRDGETFLTQGRTEEFNHHSIFGYKFDTRIANQRYIVKYAGNTYYIGFATEVGRNNNWKVPQFKQFLKDPDVQYFLNTFDDEKTERKNALISDMQIAAIASLGVYEHIQMNLRNSKTVIPESSNERVETVQKITLKDHTPPKGPEAGSLSYTLADGRINLTNRSVTNGTFDFVITNEGKLVIGSKHFALSEGATSVQAAGQLRIYKGKVMDINNSSGYYRPSIEESRNFGTILKNAGVDVSGANLNIYNMEGTKVSGTKL